MCSKSNSALGCWHARGCCTSKRVRTAMHRTSCPNLALDGAAERALTQARTKAREQAAAFGQLIVRSARGGARIRREVGDLRGERLRAHGGDVRCSASQIVRGGIHYLQSLSGQSRQSRGHRSLGRWSRGHRRDGGCGRLLLLQLVEWLRRLRLHRGQRCRSCRRLRRVCGHDSVRRRCTLAHNRRSADRLAPVCRDSGEWAVGRGRASGRPVTLIGHAG